MINYDSKFKEWLKNNLEIVKASTDEEWLKLKVRNFAEKHQVKTYNEIMELIKTDDLIASFFAKDPSKQGIHEKIAGDYLKTIFRDLKILPKAGKDALYVVDGKISNNRPDKTYKSIDFVFSYKGYTIFASHKYTKESGGAQDNQRNDLMSFIKHSHIPVNEKHIFIAIADGDYYTKNNKNNLKQISDCSKDKKVFVCSSNDVKKKIDDLLSIK